jgi:hypothetical protein
MASIFRFAGHCVQETQQEQLLCCLSCFLPWSLGSHFSAHWLSFHLLLLSAVSAIIWKMLTVCLPHWLFLTDYIIRQARERWIKSNSFSVIIVWLYWNHKLDFWTCNVCQHSSHLYKWIARDFKKYFCSYWRKIFDGVNMELELNCMQTKFVSRHQMIFETGIFCQMTTSIWNLIQWCHD